MPQSGVNAKKNAFPSLESGARGLDRRARNGTVGAEDTAIARFRSQGRAASGAFVENLAGIDRHLFSSRRPAIGARDHGMKDLTPRRCLIWSGCTARLHGAGLESRYETAPYVLTA
jgi:hypothetical protein